MRGAERVISKVLKEVTKPKKNSPPRVGGGNSGGHHFNAPESSLPEFRIVELVQNESGFVLEKFLGDYGHSGINDGPEWGEPSSNPELDIVEEMEDEQKRNRKPGKTTTQGGASQGRRKGYPGRTDPVEDPPERRTVPTPPIFEPTPDPPGDDGGWPVIPPVTTEDEPDFDIPPDEDQPDEEDKERREEEFPSCEEIEDELRSLGIQITLCGGKGQSGIQIVGKP